MKASDLLTREELRALTRASDARGWLSVGVSWGLVAGAMALAAAWPGPLTVALALVIIGGRQLALAVLLHECAHGSLFHTRWLNQAVGTWLCGGPTWTSLGRYRVHHLKHHTRTNTDDDPDLGLITPFPTTRSGAARKLLRDLSGVTALRRVVGLLLMDLGFLSYTASTGARRLRPALSALPGNAARHLGPVALTNAALLGLLYALDQPWLYALWLGAYATTFSAFLRVRAWAEHAVTERSTDARYNVRTTLAGPLARLTVAPHHVNYHLEHHLLLSAPHYRLPAMHALLRARGVFDARNLAPSYLAVLDLVSGGARQGEPPCPS